MSLREKSKIKWENNDREARLDGSYCSAAAEKLAHYKLRASGGRGRGKGRGRSIEKSSAPPFWNSSIRNKFTVRQDVGVSFSFTRCHRTRSPQPHLFGTVQFVMNSQFVKKWEFLFHPLSSHGQSKVFDFLSESLVVVSCFLRLHPPLS